MVPAGRLFPRLACPLTRFAPAPTGYLHLGHVVNAVFVWGLARALGGRVLLRIEDHDRSRCRPQYESALLGAQRQDLARQCGDLLLRDRLGQWTYQFAVVVDDLRQGIDLVIRGNDLLASTGRQLRLARLLGRDEPPIYLHHPLVRKPGGAKLSKSDGDTGIRELRAAGVSAESVLGRAARLAGLIEEQRPIRANGLAALLSSRA